MSKENLPVNSAAENDLFPPHTIRAVNQLSEARRRAAYARLVPASIFKRFGIDANFHDADGNDLLDLRCDASLSVTEMSVYHQVGFRDPLLYGQITDTLNGQIHILLYILNDPDSPRFDVDRMPDGTRTLFGAEVRNIEAELAALRYGLTPGQLRRGLGLLGEAIEAFESFVASMDQEIYFAEPLHYHNAVLFERHGFSYAQGRRLMERIQAGFAPGGDLLPLLDNSSPFRSPQAADSIRLRSWAIHDNILGAPFNHVTMYKKIGVSAGLNTCPGCSWA